VFTGTVTKQVDFGKTMEVVETFRETKHHWINEKGEKFSKKTGNSLSGRKWKGIFLGRQLNLETVKPL